MSDRLFASGWKDYELIDAGGGKKLERWGSIVTIRPEVQAYFKSEKPFSDWRKMAHWEFIPKKGQTGVWKSLNKAPESWEIGYKRLKFQLKLTKFKHVGLFPEQNVNWQFLEEHLQSDDRFLNLFAYTGAASLVGRGQGAETFHVDSVKQLISWAKENMELSRLLNIKWVHEDALKFAGRELKREKQYDAIIMDPPAWGIGAKKEKWKLEDKLDELIDTAMKLLSPNGVLVMNTYSPTVDLALLNQMADLYCSDRDWSVQELWMKTSTEKDLYYGNLLRIKNA